MLFYILAYTKYGEGVDLRRLSKYFLNGLLPINNVDLRQQRSLLGELV